MRRKIIFPITALLIFVLCWSINSWGESSCKDMPGLLTVKFKSGVLTNYGLVRSKSLSTGIASFDQLNQKYNALDIR